MELLKDKLPTLLMCVGIPGSGKSTWINDYVKTSFKQWTILSHDELKKEILHNVSDQSKNRELALLIRQQARKFLLQNKNVIIDQTNVSTKYRKQFTKDLPPCHLVAKLFDITPKEAIDRISCDITNGKDRSNVSPVVVIKMYAKYIYSKKVIASEGFKLL